VRLAFLVGGLLIGLVIGSYAGYQYGQFHALHRDFERRYEEDRGLVAPLLAADPAFRRIVTENFPVAGICLAGPVESQEDLRRLHGEMARLFGERRVGHIMQDVVVERSAEPVAAPDRGGR
jgi:hypothetical protein